MTGCRCRCNADGVGHLAAAPAESGVPASRAPPKAAGRIRPAHRRLASGSALDLSRSNSFKSLHQSNVQVQN